MTSEPIRVLVVDATPEGGQTLSARLDRLEGIEVVGVAHNRNAAKAQAEALEPDVLLIDLMLPNHRSIEVVRHVINTQLQVRILALVPGDPPHEHILLAVEAGALGYVCRDADISEFQSAIERVHQGRPWLPLDETYEVLQESAGELVVTASERRDHLVQIILGLIPLTGLIAAVTAYLWRQYWGAIDVRVVDLGVDPTTRMIDVLIVFLRVIGIFGPLLFVRPWLAALSDWINKEPRRARLVARLQNMRLGTLPVGHIFFGRWIVGLQFGLLLLFVMLLLNEIMPLIVVMFFGPAVGIVLLSNALDMEDALPEALHLPHLDSGRVLGFLAVVLVVFMLVLGTEVLVIGPDLRPDGIHGFMAPKVLGLRAEPIVLYDLEEEHEPLEALYLGGNADLYVLYDPCEKKVRLVPVSLSRVDVIDKVTCRSP